MRRLPSRSLQRHTWAKAYMECLQENRITSAKRNNKNFTKKIMTIRDPQFKFERNKSIWQDRRNGMIYKDLAKKYGITQPRARQIYESYDRWYNNDEWKKRHGFVYY